MDTEEYTLVARPTTMAETLGYHNALTQMRQHMLVEGVDYGVIPGTTKPTLLKPGAEKLCTRFGLTPTFTVVEAVRDFTGNEHNGEPLFFFEIKCQVFFHGDLVAEGVGNCSSWEGKYRYRQADRLCPMCGQAAIIKGKEEYGGGWLCFGKKGGCGAKWKIGDQAIEGQVTGQILNPNVFDIVNTVRKMADKRALIASVLIATGASEYFTQDIEDGGIIDIGPWQPQPAQLINAELDPQGHAEAENLLALKANLSIARVLLKEKGGRPRDLTQKQVEAMSVAELQDAIKTTKRAIELYEVDTLAAGGEL